MRFDHLAQNDTVYHVLLKDSGQTQSAITTLNGGYLFNREVMIKVSQPIERSQFFTFGIERGWYAFKPQPCTIPKLTVSPDGQACYSESFYVAIKAA